MKYSERKQFMDTLNWDGLAGAGKDAVAGDKYFRSCLLTLLASMADSLDSMAYAYKEMLTIQQAREKQPRRPAAGASNNSEIPATPANESRYGGR